MADVTVKVKMNPDWERTVKTMPSVMSALDKKAASICGKANSMASGFKTQKWTDPKTKERKGDTRASYRAKEAKEFGRTSVALVYTANYAAQKENMKHNTLLKSI